MPGPGGGGGGGGGRGGGHGGHGGPGHHGGPGGPGWGGPGFWGPGFWGPGFWGPPGPGPERGCWWCLWCCVPPPPPPVIVVDSYGNPVRQTPQVVIVENKPSYREIKALEYREGDTPVKYFLNVPEDINYGQTIQVDLGGTVFSVRIPDYVQRGEKVIVIAPAPVSHGRA